MFQNARDDSSPYAAQPDEWLVERCRQSGDDAAFAELVQRYRAPVFRLVASILGQEFSADAEDVAQDVLVLVHHSLGSFRGEAKFSSWLYRIAFNQSLNVKARMRYRAPHVSSDVLASTPSGDRGADEQIHADRRRLALLECVGELPEVYQAALRLHYWLGSSVSEVAALLEVPENTVKSYLYRARRLLQSMLEKRGFDER